MTKAWIEAAGRNYGANRMYASIKTQQKFYNQYIKIPAEHREEATQLGIEWWNRKIMKGPGVDW